MLYRLVGNYKKCVGRTFCSWNLGEQPKQQRKAAPKTSPIPTRKKSTIEQIQKRQPSFLFFGCWTLEFYQVNFMVATYLAQHVYEFDIDDQT